MTKQEELDFLRLTQIRTQGADLLGKRFLRGMWDGIVKKYSDQAHFIYELLQNADDAGAKSARFILERDRLIFAHNGTRLFSVSNPDTEDYDTEHGNLGDINAITSVANSNKTEASIGKFGVGFKAVFQYTASPRIYGPNLRFRIDRYIVPTLLDDDFSDRHSNETLFVFPFDRNDMSAENAYSDISEKLQALSYPLLFLSQLRDISFEFGNNIGLYEKKCNEERWFGKTVAQHLTMTQNSGNELYDDSLWLFTREDDCGRVYSCGFFTDESGNILPVNEPAFCFFPTKEITGLNFIVHAPFLLTDSREGIRAGEPHNEKMINLLAKLSADAFLYLRDIGIERGSRLIDDNVISIIPYNEGSFSEVSDKRKASFKPFFTAIKELFSTSKIIPSTDSYVERSNAYWAAVPQLTSLFTNVHLVEITGNKNAEWAFPSLGRDGLQRNNSVLGKYLDAIVQTSLTEDHILNVRSSYIYSVKKEIPGISSDFVERQTIEWLQSFYKWLSETKHRTEVAAKKTVFLNQNRKAVAAFDAKGQPILFLPTKEITDCITVYPALLENEVTAKFLETVGIKEPSIKDHIYNNILPLYKSDEAIDTVPHFALFFKYYRRCPKEEVQDFIDLIKNFKFLTFYEQGDDTPYRCAANELYFPTDDLTAYFSAKPATRFIALDEYKALVEAKHEKALISFLTELGVRDVARLYTEEINWDEIRRRQLPQPYSTGATNWSETRIDGCRELVASIVDKPSIEKSVALWNELLQVINAECLTWRKLADLLMGKCSYFYYKSHADNFVSSDAELLQTSAWLVDDEGSFVSPTETTKQTMSDSYDLDDERVDELFEFLNIHDKNEDIEDDSEDDADDEDESLLSDKQRERITLGKQCEQMGLTEEDLLEAAERKRQRKVLEAAAQLQANQALEEPQCEFDDEPWQTTDGTVDTAVEDDNEGSWEDGNDASAEDTLSDDTNTDQQQQKKVSKATSRVIRDIVNRTQDKPTAELDPSLYISEDEDEDEFTRSPIDYGARIERAKQKSAGEISRIEYFENLQRKAIESQKYSYGWFTALLEMEALSNSDNNLNSREVSISFARVEREPGTHRTLVLKYPNRYIPQFMEDLADIPLMLAIGDKTKTVAIEVASIKSYTLRVKLKANVDIDDVNLSQVTEARIDAKSPSFLLEELRKQFADLGFKDDFDMRANLCKNIEFVFGPPGTGKTTYLARNVLIPLMMQKDNVKVLVLTPTNKAADVLLKRVIEVMRDDMSYHNWLVRFGATQDEAIESSPVFRDKTFDIRSFPRNITVTTIARFPYDFFMPSGSRLYLHSINWDYIVIDEASMIPLISIIYPLYKKTPQKFLIAGDPFQIEPITSVDLWKDENIYTMVQLNSFAMPHTVPNDYKVTLLTTQYRSTPVLGEIFSKFAYGGILKHHRPQVDRRPLNIESVLPVKSLNLIKFPVSKYESIYRSKRLQQSSSYQVYSAIFTCEFISFLAEQIAKANPLEEYRIGIIAPYRAQADLIDKLLASTKLPDKVEVQVGTIHGFQGDECNIILAVYNTPPTISASKKMFLNKRNIINVSISRAKDYMFVLMPDDNTSNIDNLHLVRFVERLMKASGDCAEFMSSDLELTLFGDSHYIEENAFTTGHQSVNVYALPEKCYEIRSEDNAVDVQIHKDIKATAHSSKTEKEAFSPPLIYNDRTVYASPRDSAIVEFVWLENKTQVCPYDAGILRMNPIPVEKINGEKKKINMSICSKCGKRFIIRNSLSSSILLSDYKIIGHLLNKVKMDTPPVISSSDNEKGMSLKKATQASKEMVHSTSYGAGEVIRHYISPTNGPMISIRFDIGDKEFVEKKAFDSGALVRV